MTPPDSGGTFAHIVLKKKKTKLREAHKHPIQNMTNKKYWNPKHQKKIGALYLTWCQ